MSRPGGTFEERDWDPYEFLLAGKVIRALPTSWAVADKFRLP
jgi:hypothetical protein